MCAAVLLCALLLTLPPSSIAYAGQPEAWPTVPVWIPPTHVLPAEVPSAVIETPALPPVLAPTNTPTTAPPTDTPTPLATFTTVPSDTPTDTPTDTPLPTDTASPTETATSTPSWLPPDSSCYVKPGKAQLILDVPYIHQVNDLSAADGNWACGPTSVAMVLAYYSKLQPWQSPDLSASPTPALPDADSGAPFAPYVTSVYTNNGHTYSALAADPHGKMLAGLYGTIAPTGLADWGRIKSVLDWHGLASKNISVSFEGIQAALDRGHPVLIGNGLTAEGHILVAVGYTDNDQLIVNDPYGNRFASGYGSNQGQNVYYAWSCMRARTALEVIGTYIPPATATPTASATSPATETPTATPTEPATATPSSAVYKTLGLLATTPTEVSGSPSARVRSSILHNADTLIAAAAYNADKAGASARAGATPGNLPAVVLLLGSVLGLVAGSYWLITSFGHPEPSLRSTDRS